MTDDEKFKQFALENQDKIKMWFKDHGNPNIPVIKNEQGEFIWLNREKRRKINKQLRRRR